MPTAPTETRRSRREAEVVAVAKLVAHPQATRVPGMDQDEFAAFRADVVARGILEPITINAKRVVLDGRQRLRAARELGRSTIEAVVVAPVDEVEFIVLAALRRRNLSASQRAVLGVELAAYKEARRQAARRKRSGHKDPRAGLPEPQRPRDLAAKAVGASARTVQDVITVQQEDPLLYEAVKRGEVAASAAAQQVRQRRRYDAIGKAPTLPTGSFEVILADPPWPSDRPGSAWSPENHYPTMPLDQIKQLRVPAADNAILFLWCIAPQTFRQGFAVLNAWDFEEAGQLVWVKPSIGLGGLARYRHEVILIGRRGRFPLPPPAQRPDSVIEAPRQEHSRKPDATYELIERMYPRASKLELFARGTPRDGWSAWGNQVTAK